ncbi:hypothetical protein H8356DRAFT_1350291 [Neocallimastix lanati (nom. inval.)]|nr:hypothetical protein H8356DRAFT_1350291 [Neocallimastix sp. JGI-2020a]
MYKEIYNIIILIELLLFILPSTGKKIEFYSLSPIRIFKSNNTNIHNSNYISKNKKTKEHSNNYKNYTEPIYDIKIKNITFTGDDVFIKNFTLSSNEILLENQNINYNFTNVLLKTEETIDKNLDGVMILGNNETVNENFENSPFVIENINTINSKLENNKLYQYNKIYELHCDEKPIYKINDANFDFYNDDCHTLTFYCKENGQPLSTDSTDTYISPEEINNGCKLVTKKLNKTKRTDSNNDDIDDSYFNSDKYNECDFVSGSLSAFLAAASVVVPVFGELSAPVVLASGLAGASAGVSTVTCIYDFAMNHKDDDCCCKSDVTNCGGGYAACSPIITHSCLRTYDIK